MTGVVIAKLCYCPLLLFLHYFGSCCLRRGNGGAPHIYDFPIFCTYRSSHTQLVPRIMRGSWWLRYFILTHIRTAKSEGLGLWGYYYKHGLEDPLYVPVISYSCPSVLWLYYWFRMVLKRIFRYSLVIGRTILFRVSINRGVDSLGYELNRWFGSTWPSSFNAVVIFVCLFIDPKTSFIRGLNVLHK